MLRVENLFTLCLINLLDIWVFGDSELHNKIIQLKFLIRRAIRPDFKTFDMLEGEEKKSLKSTEERLDGISTDGQLLLQDIETGTAHGVRANQHSHCRL